MTQAEDELVRDCASQLGHGSFGSGSMARLRRMDPRQPVTAPPALHRLLARLPNEVCGGRHYDRWVLLVHVLALAAPERHCGGHSLGTALFAAGYSEGRLTRLLAAPEAALPVVLPRMVRFLVTHDQLLDPYELANLILRSDRLPSRLRIARDYYRAELRLSKLN